MVRIVKTRLRVAIDKLPYIRDLRKRADDCGAFAPGHFYSPIPNQEEVDRVVARMRSGFSSAVMLDTVEQQRVGNLFPQ